MSKRALLEHRTVQNGAYLCTRDTKNVFFPTEATLENIPNQKLQISRYS